MLLPAAIASLPVCRVQLPAPLPGLIAAAAALQLAQKSAWLWLPAAVLAALHAQELP